MHDAGSGGLAAVSVGISEIVVGLVILVLILFGVWKLWAAISG